VKASVRKTKMWKTWSVHRCTWVENPEEGVPDVFCQNPWGGGGGQGFQKKLPGGPNISGYIAFLLTSVLKFAWGRYYIYPPPTLSEINHWEGVHILIKNCKYLKF
jgi:hypothetical protein